MFKNFFRDNAIMIPWVILSTISLVLTRVHFAPESIWLSTGAPIFGSAVVATLLVWAKSKMK